MPINQEHENILAKVRALLDRAASTDSANEADVCRTKADLLMSRFAIEQWMLDNAKDKQTLVPERRDFDFSWWWGNPFKDQLWTLFNDTARHCRCRPVRTKLDYQSHRLPVLGLPSDLDWFDLLFTNLMMAMIQKVDPQPRLGLSVDENMALMREAGLPWNDALNRLALSGVVPKLDEARYAAKDNQKLWFSTKTYTKAINDYRRFCRETGHPQSYVNQMTFRKHFSDGFAEEVGMRLWRMKRESQKAYDNEHESGSMALAVRDIEQIIKDMMYEIWPDLKPPPPHPDDCDCDSCHDCDDPKCQRYWCKQKRKPVRYRSRAQPKIDRAAREAGRQAGREVNLSNSPSDRIGNRKGLPS